MANWNIVKLVCSQYDVIFLILKIQKHFCENYVHLKIC